MPQVTVVGHDGGGFGAAAGAALARATLVAGGERHLSGLDVSAECLVMGPVAPVVARVAAHDGDAVVLASGDPGFFGIVAALRRAGIEPVVIPAVSSVAAAFARAGLPWDDALVVSAHGRDRVDAPARRHDPFSWTLEVPMATSSVHANGSSGPHGGGLRRAVNVCRAYPKVAVLTAPGSGPAELGAALAGWERTLVVAERLGTPQERLVTVEAAQAHTAGWADPNVVLVLDPTRPDVRPGPGWIAGAGPGPAGWALPEAAYAHRDSMITKAEVRAYVLARLGPRIGDLVWDVGAGSGSVAVECARFGAAVLAVERDPAALPLITANTAGLGVRLVAGDAPGCLAGLPEPDAVFVGGGGPPVLAACAARRPSRLVTAVAGVERVGPALAVLSAAGYRAEGVQLQAARLSVLPDGAHRLAATNPVFVVSGELP
ncbi:precorrin-6y C5,15-methyltransferase (decarboxylating) subunit CbiE [Catellatospora chokoriensis]|uniref:Precorrin-6y C5,15-methyltransferase subunit CbiE n=1 Tax=Catellatospora chokoriensis TaxID=310353 RepID=A0A8J3NQR9_9ACTN|nr:precorrin-6y C5,15-methyltransferase (decarboxylating) subunit CbiE [Catellatospora chokoriensis]GIF89215.1 precorrin-6y C5,15-methyltransferase subunit CbiE [Catellatospora chokoriensis]